MGEIFLSFHPDDTRWTHRIATFIGHDYKCKALPYGRGAILDLINHESLKVPRQRPFLVLVSPVTLASKSFLQSDYPALETLHKEGRISLIPLLVEPLRETLTDDLPLITGYQIPALSELSEEAMTQRVRSLLNISNGGRTSNHADQTKDDFFEKLYHRNFHPLVYFFGHRGCDAELSRELAQETMMKAYQGLDDFQGKANIKTWLQEIAINTWRNWLRAQRYSQKRSAHETSLDAATEIGFDIDENAGFWSQTRASSNIERQAIEREARRRIYERLERLAPRQRQCLERWLNGAPYQEIVEELGVSMQTVRATLHKAKERLLQELRGEFSSGDKISSSNDSTSSGEPS